MYGISITNSKGEKAYLINCDSEVEGKYNLIYAMGNVINSILIAEEENWSTEKLWKTIAKDEGVQIKTKISDGIRGLYLTDELDGVMEYTDYNGIVEPNACTIIDANCVKGFDEEYTEDCPVMNMKDKLFNAWNFEGDVVLNPDLFGSFWIKFQAFFTKGRIYLKHGDDKYTFYLPEGLIKD